MENIKFRSAHYYYMTTGNGHFSHFSYWGLINHKGDFDDSCFCSPSQNSTTYRKVEEQYTGLKDRNGVDIYEGDIVTYKSFDMNIRMQGVMIFKDGSFCIKTDMITAYRLMDYDIEVLGNIHENKQVVK